MKSQWKFVLVLLVGIGLLVLGLAYMSYEDSAFVSQALANQHGWVPPCSPGDASGCVTWPYISLALIVLGGLTALAGFIGIIETHFPRGDV